MSPALTATGDANARYTHPVADGLPDASPISTPLRHNATAFTPVSAAIRYHHTPRTTPEHAKLTRCAVSTAYCEPIAICDGGTWEKPYSNSPPPPANTVVVVAAGVVVVVVTGIVVVVGAAVDVVVVEVGEPAAGVKSGVMKYSDARYDNVGRTGTGE